jgi:hypothetical protein
MIARITNADVPGLQTIPVQRRSHLSSAEFWDSGRMSFSVWVPFDGAGGDAIVGCELSLGDAAGCIGWAINATE